MYVHFSRQTTMAFIRFSRQLVAHKTFRVTIRVSALFRQNDILQPR